MQLQVVLALKQGRLLFTEMLGTLLERVLLQSVLSGKESLTDVFELLALDADLVLQLRVFVLQLLVLVALLRVEVVEASLVGEVDIVDLLLV